MESQDIRNEALRSAPAAGVIASTYLGFTLSDWVYIVTIVYMLVQIGWMGVKIYRSFKNRGEGK